MAGLIYDLYDEEERRHARGLGDFHLRCALTYLDVQELSEKRGRGREIKSYQKILRKFGKLKSGEAGRLCAKICLESNLNDPQDVPHMDRAYRLLKTEYKGLGFLTKPGDPFDRLLRLIKTSSNVQTKTYKTKILLQKALMVSNAMTSERSYQEFGLEMHQTLRVPMVEIGSITLFLIGELFVARWERLDTVYRIDVLRMITDKLTERDNVLLASFFGRYLFQEVYPSPELLVRVFSLFDRWLVVQGNDGYKLLKSFEAIMTGIIISRKKSDYFDSRKFLEDTISGHSEEEKEVAWNLVKIIEESHLSLHHLTQITGLFRLWGHPEVDTRKGVEKVRVIGTTKKFISPHESLQAGWKFKEIWYLNYYIQNRRYPKFSVLDHDNWIVQNLEENIWINIKEPQYHLSDWDAIQTEETFAVPKSFNLSMIVSDTAISPTRKEIQDSTKAGNPPMDPSVRRGVLKWMKDGLIDCHQLLDGINRHPWGLPREHRAIGLYPKEREMNPIARMFALMTLMMRSYVVITENMLSENVVPLIPGITMTYSLLELAKEMIRVTTSQRKQGANSRTFCINMDFEKWNLNMRRESTEHVFRELGRMFGLPNLYNRTYDIFEHSLIYLADGTYTPDLDDELNPKSGSLNEIYEGHIGGFEGLRQKGWTIFTVVLIAHVCDSMGVQYKLMGQGDNQVLMVTIHSKQARIYGLASESSKNEVRAKLGMLLSKLRETFDKVGLPLKPLETWVSDSFFSYGKMPIYEGLPLCSSLKRISRIFFFSNEDLMTTDNALGAITANAQSAVMVDIHPIVPYFIAKWQHLQCLSIFSKYHPLIGGAPHSFDSEKIYFSLKFKSGEMLKACEVRLLSRETLILTMASIPKTLGGFNVVCFFDMVLRGFSDPVSKDYQFLMMMALKAKQSLRYTLRNWSDVFLSPDIDYLHLLQDPTSLNLMCPPNASTIIKRMIHRTIDGLASDSEFSKWFKELMSISAEKKVEPLVEKLTSGSEINARMCHDILGATLYGYADSIASKVDKTVTLSRITLGQQDVVGSLIAGERKIWDYMVWRSHFKGGRKRKEGCPSLYIRNVRNEGWKKEVIGVSTPYPFHYITEDSLETDRPDSYVEVVVGDDVVGDPRRMMMISGSSLPYLGSVTKEKLHSTASKAAYGTEPLITRPIRLLRAIGWFIDEESNWAASLTNLLEAVTDLDPLDIISVPDHVKGSMMHRYVDMALKHGSLWMPSYGPPSHLSISTNMFAEYAKGSKNVTVHFQALLGLIQFSAMNQNFGQYPKKLIHYFRGCKDCIIPVEEPKEDLKEALTSLEIPSNPENPYLYIKKEDIALVHRQELENYTSIPQVPSDWLANKPALARRFLTEVLAVKAATAILSSTSKGDLIFDIAGLSRTMFLKVDILDLFKTTAKMLWIGASTGKRIKADRIYPSWSYMKISIIRRIWESPISSFAVLSGVYLWKENLDYMREMSWAQMPETYPVTPTSIGLAAKNTLIRVVKMCKDIAFPSSMMVSPLVKVDPNLLLKGHLLFSRGKLRAKCSNCVATGLSSLFKADYTWGDLHRVKCSDHHTVFTAKGWRLLKKVNLDIESLADLVPSSGRVIEHLTSETQSLKVEYPDDMSYILFHSGMINGFSYFEGMMPGEEFYERPELEMDLTLHFSLPTKSLYRVYEIMGSVRTLREMGRILVMGDGYGYSSMMMKALVPDAQVYSWTLIDVPSSVQHCLRLSKPPTHFALKVDVDSSLTIDEVSDVGSSQFEETFARVLEEKKIDAVLSEIEYKYSDTEDKTFDLIRMMWKMKIKTIIIKFETISFAKIKSAIEVVWRYYRNWRISETSISGLHTGEVWLIMSEPRSEVGRWVFLSQEDVNSLYRELRNSHENMKRWGGSMRIMLNKELEASELTLYITGMLDGWFQEANVMGWMSLDMTKVFYGIKTGRRPERILDMTGNPVYYLHFGMENQLFVRLMVLAMSLLDNIGCIAEELTEENLWDLQWEREGIKGGPRGVYQWAPALVKKKRQSLLWTKTNRDLICRYLPVVRARFDRLKEEKINQMEHEEIRSTMVSVGNSIRFKYMRGAEKPLHFPVTKIASFLVPHSEL